MQPSAACRGRGLPSGAQRTLGGTQSLEARSLLFPVRVRNVCGCRLVGRCYWQVKVVRANERGVAYESVLVEVRELEEVLALHLQSLGRRRDMLDEFSQGLCAASKDSTTQSLNQATAT